VAPGVGPDVLQTGAGLAAGAEQATDGEKINPRNHLMSRKQQNDIGKVLLEIAIAVTPIILETGRRWLQSDDRIETSPASKRKPKR